MSKSNIPAGWKIESTELPHVIAVTAPTGARWRLLRDSNPDDGPSQCIAALAVALFDAAPTPPVDAVLGEPVAESAGAWKSRLMTEACSKWSGAQKIEAGDIIEWIADFRVQAAPVASRAAQSEPISAWMPPGRPWISDDGMETLQGVIAMLEPLERGEATRSNKPDHLLATTHIGKATIKDAMRVLSFAVPMLKKVRHELR